MRLTEQQLARLDAVIAQLERAGTDAEAQQAARAMTQLYDEAIGQIPLIGSLFAAMGDNAFARQGPVSLQMARDEVLPSLRQFRAMLGGRDRPPPPGPPTSSQSGRLWAPVSPPSSFTTRPLPTAPAGPRNVPTRPGCFGGTSGVLLALLVLAWMLLR
jgi:hypothetical protein